MFVDLAVKPIARGELKRFAERLKVGALVDQSSRAYRDAGLAYMRLDEGELFDRLLADQALLRLPLVRAEQRFSVGVDETAWKQSLSSS